MIILKGSTYLSRVFVARSKIYSRAIKKKVIWKKAYVKAASFIEAKKWKQAKYPTILIRINRKPHKRMPLNMKNHSTDTHYIRMNIMSGKKSQMQKTTDYMIEFMWNIQKRPICNLWRKEINSCLWLGLEVGLTINRQKRFFFRW